MHNWPCVNMLFTAFYNDLSGRATMTNPTGQHADKQISKKFTPVSRRQTAYDLTIIKCTAARDV